MNASETQHQHPTLGIIGAGKVGNVLGQALHNVGYQIVAVYSRTPDHALTLAEATGARVALSAQEVLTGCDLTLLSVPDDTITPLAEQLAQDIIDGSKRAVIHASGARNLHSLKALANRGFSTGSLHPALPFANIEAALEQLRGTTFAIETNQAPLRDWLSAIVIAIGGQALYLSPDEKTVYHAALVITSNYTVTLYAVAQTLLRSLGADTRTADGALNKILSATVHNIVTQGIPQALTGPLTRADIGTLETHLNALNALDPSLAELYRQLARQTYPILDQRGVDTRQIETFLQNRTP